MKSTNNANTPRKKHIFLDIHSHVLPAVDDGPQTEDLSIAMLCEERKQADRTFGMSSECVVVATPHFLSYNTTVDEFLARRKAGFERLLQAVNAHESDDVRRQFSRIDLVLGAEIMVNSELDKVDGLDKLFLGNSRMLMFEFSESYFSPYYIQVIERICYKYRATPVIAHFERYASFMTEDDYNALMGLKNVILQFNAHFLCPRGNKFIFKNIISSSGAFVLKFQRYGTRLVLGSDCHSMGIRKPSCEIGFSGAKQFMKEESREAFFDFTDSLAEEVRFGIDDDNIDLKKD